MVHQLQKEVIFAVDVLPHGRSLKRLIELAEAQAGLDVARRTAGGGNDAVSMLRDELSIHARPLAQLALIGGQRGQGKKVAQAGGVFRNHCLVEVGAGSGDIVALLVRCAP